MNKEIVVQDEWNDEDDVELLDHIKTLDHSLKIISKHEIIKLDPKNVEMLFCNTSVMQKYIAKHNPNYKVIDTYPECFKDIYHRNISVMKLKECFKMYMKENKPYFVKPCKNNKRFAGFVINNNNDRFSIYQLAAYDTGNDLETSMDIYVCDQLTPLRTKVRRFLLQ